MKQKVKKQYYIMAVTAIAITILVVFISGLLKHKEATVTLTEPEAVEQSADREYRVKSGDTTYTFRTDGILVIGGNGSTPDFENLEDSQTYFLKEISRRARSLATKFLFARMRSLAEPFCTIGLSYSVKNRPDDALSSGPKASTSPGRFYFSYKNFSGRVTLKSFARSRKSCGVMVCSLSGLMDSIFTKISAAFSTVCIRPKVRSKSSPEANMP